MKRIAAALLCLLLTACGAEAQTAPSPLAQAAGLDENAPLLTVDGRTVPAWEYLYWLAEDCAQLEPRYAEAGEALDWTAPGPDGSTPEALVKAAALSDTALCATVSAWASAYDCEPSEAERTALSENTSLWLTADQSRALAEYGQQYIRLYRLYQTPGSPLAPAADELALFQRENGLLAAERVLISYNGDREAARQQISALFARVNGAEDPQAAFTALLTETGGGVMTAADWTPALTDAAAALDSGQLSGILETETGFAILRRLPDDEAALRETYFDALLLDAANVCDIQVSANYDALQAAVFWEKLKESVTP